MKKSSISTSALSFLITIILTFIFSTVLAQLQTSSYRSVGGFVTGASEVLPDVKRPASELSFKCSNAGMLEGFHWAKQQALSYVFSNDPVGPWYEWIFRSKLTPFQSRKSKRIFS
jgi:hypothetical protein